MAHFDLPDGGWWETDEGSVSNDDAVKLLAATGAGLSRFTVFADGRTWAHHYEEERKPVPIELEVPHGVWVLDGKGLTRQEYEEAKQQLPPSGSPSTGFQTVHPLDGHGTYTRANVGDVVVAWKVVTDELEAIPNGWTLLATIDTKNAKVR